MLRVTDSAAAGLDRLLREKGVGNAGLRLAVERGGCAGLQYSMTLSAPQPGDLVVPCGPHSIFVDAASAGHFEGCTLDFEDGLSGSGFRVVNPRAVRSCGCGTSFEPAAASG
ncbi:MAG: iron-sulfur cluster assembly accessory protein [Terrimicrobiaceae bacterium]|nr:iron-sulfur cluster assembly accessory protein [Terrimicrobiaceae bacterium]